MDVNASPDLAFFHVNSFREIKDRFRLSLAASEKELGLMLILGSF